MFLECQRSWNSCSRPEKAHLLATGTPQSTLKRRTILLETGLRISTPLRRTQAVTQKIQRLFEKATFSANTKLFSHGLGRKSPLNLGFSVSALGEFHSFGGKNSQNSDLAVAIIVSLAEADAQNAFTSGSYRPFQTLRL
jgi:hypothetical protein